MSETGKGSIDYENEYLSLQFEKEFEPLRARQIAARASEVIFENPPEVLDIGVGRQAISRSLPFELKSLTLVEPMRWSLEADRLKFGEESAQRFEGKLESYPPNQDFIEKFDLVIASSVLHEVESPRRFLLKCVSLLKETGRLIVVVPNRYSVHRILGSYPPVSVPVRLKTATEARMGQRRAYSLASLAKEVEAVGCTAEFMETFILKPTSHALMSEALNSGVIGGKDLDALGRLGLLVPGFGAEILGIFTKLQ